MLRLQHIVLKGISYVFHPLLMPLLGVVFYFSKTPRFIAMDVMKAQIFSVVILTIIIPILVYFLLKTFKRVEGVELKTTKERILPLSIHILIFLLLLIRVFKATEVVALYTYFLGLMCTNVLCLTLALLKIKASIHMMFTWAFFTFTVMLAIAYKININGTLALTAIIIGAIATSRLHLKAHTTFELIMGSLIGSIPQVILFVFIV